MKVSAYLISALLLTVAVDSQSAKGGNKPPPEPSPDVACDGCVDTADISDGAVTTEKLGALAGAFAPLVWVDALGNILGEDVGEYGHEYGDLDTRIVQSPKGYRFELGVPNGWVGRSRTVYYEKSDCTGLTYIDWHDVEPGYVFRNDYKNQLYYTGFVYDLRAVGTYSHSISNRCLSGGIPYDYKALEVFPNDVEITGVNPYAQIPLSREPLY